MQRTTSCWAVLLLCAAAPFARAANTWTVTAGGSGGSCTADVTTDPNCTLDAAIAVAGDGDTIFFAAAVQGSTIRLNDTNALTAGLIIDASPDGVILDGGDSGSIFYLQSGTFVLSHLTLQNGNPNAIFNAGAMLTVNSCTFKANSAAITGDTHGGAINAVSGYVTVINSTFIGNSSSIGGGAIWSSGNVSVSNSTITGNSSANGGGIGGYGFTIMSSIVAGNSATTSAPDVYGFSGQVSLGYNIIGNSSGSGLSATTGDQFGVDPLFVTAGLANNGGATQTVALKSLSPARSGGNCAGNDGSNGYPVTPAVTLDQRGYTRTSAGAIGCTVGAFDMTSIFYSGFDD